LLPALWREHEIELIHTHTLGRLGGIAAAVARQRHLPFVVTIHGGYLDLPKPLQESFSRPSNRGFDWGRFFGLVFQSRQMLHQADALLTCNPTEAALLRKQFPKTRVQVQPHGISVARYEADCRETALAAWPQLQKRNVLLCVGRIDPVKNQGWLVDQAQRLFKRHPDSILVFAGPSTDERYSEALNRSIEKWGIGQRIIFTGGLPPEDPRLIGLFQLACAVLLPSISETFGLVLLEAWAAGTAVISSRTSGAQALIEHSKDGWLFDLDKPETFHHAVDVAIENPDMRARFAAAGNDKVKREYDMPVIALRAKQLYHQLIEAKACTT
jgi:glycosyltransferase involved in cell wall biosynthesis